MGCWILLVYLNDNHDIIINKDQRAGVAEYLSRLLEYAASKTFSAQSASEFGVEKSENLMGLNYAY